MATEIILRCTPCIHSNTSMQLKPTVIITIVYTTGCKNRCFLIFCPKHRLWVLVRTTSVRKNALLKCTFFKLSICASIKIAVHLVLLTYWSPYIQSKQFQFNLLFCVLYYFIRQYNGFVKLVPTVTELIF